MSFVRPLLISLGLALASPVALALPAETPVEVQKRIEAEGGLIKIGERAIDPALLKDFYRQRGYRLAWSGNGEGKGDRLLLDLQAIAVAEGLVPDSYAVPATSSDIDRDLLVSDAVARFARDLSVGRVVPTRALGGMAETRPEIDANKFLRDLAGGKDLLGLVEQLPPNYAGYQRLKAAMEQYRALVRAGGWKAIPDGPSIKPDMEDDRIALVRKRLIVTGELEAGQDKGKTMDAPLVAALKRFQARHGIEPDGTIGKQTLAALNVSAEDRLRQIVVNLERWRWMPKTMDAVHIAVNIPAAHLEFVRDGHIAMAMRVVVGDVKHQTPTMTTTMHSVVLNPTWTVPPSIATKEILPKLRKDPAYLVSNNMHILEAFAPDSPEAQGIGIDWSKYGKFPWRLRQRPGADNALGQVKFTLSNSDDIYLHDTPKRQYFGRIFRALSHGCVRLERPVDLAQAVLSSEWAPKVPDLIAEADTRTLKLEKPITVYLMYMTAWADEDGTVHFRDDLYGHDARLRAALKRPRTPAAAQVAQDHPQGAL